MNKKRIEGLLNEANNLTAIFFNSQEYKEKNE